LRRPSASRKKGSLRKPAQNRHPSTATIWAASPTDTGAPAITTSPIGPVPRAAASVDRYTAAVCPRSEDDANRTWEGDVGLEIAVGVDLELVAGIRIEAGFERRRVGIDVQDENRPIAASGRRKDVQVGDVGPRIRRISVIRHRSPPAASRPAHRAPP
jgi:hypothetical protein